MIQPILPRRWVPLWLILLLLGTATAVPVHAQQAPAADPIAEAPAQGPMPEMRSGSVYYKVQGNGDHIEMIVNTSRILVLEQRIPQLQVANPDILDLAPLSPKQVRISAKRPGVTQVDLWGEDKRPYAIDVIVTPDARELIQMLRAKFPKTHLDITPIKDSVLITGYVDRQEDVPTIVQIAEQYYPKIINKMTISGVQQGLIHVKVMEVSRTKLRRLGFDWADISSGNLVMSGVSGLLSNGASFAAPATAPDNLLKFSIQSGNNSTFFGVLDALRQDSLAKVCSEPVLVAVSGRPAYVLEGGELGYQVTNALSGTMVGFKEYGTRLDFVPIVLGNGRMRLEVRARVSQPDAANSVGGIPALKTREVETGVELRAGQTLAIAGLIEQRTEASNSGLPWISELPYVGAPFRTVRHLSNEVELLVLVTPEIADAMDTNQVPLCGPGMDSASPSDWELFFKGHLEVPKCCENGSCGSCGSNGDPSGVQPCPCDQNSAGSPATGQVSQDKPESRSTPSNPQSSSNPTATVASNGPNSRIPEPGFIGPIGYDVLK